MHLAIFGGTGPSGQCVIEEALKRNHTLTIFARTPSKVPESISSSPAITIVKGTLSDKEAVSRALDGADAVLSTLGPSLSVNTALKYHGTPLADGYKLILSEMATKGIKRLIALGTVSMETAQDGSSVVRWGLVTAVYIFLHSAWRDVVEIGRTIAASEGVEWTIARVAKLTNGNGGGEVKAGFVGKEGTGTCLVRRDLGTWYLDELENGKWIHQMPVVYSK
jgi:putative NADH-flavin reductase